MTIKAVALDAMGVIYEAANDVTELLIPYLRDRGCTLEASRIISLYEIASLGRMSSDEFWLACGVIGRDSDYCAMHTLTPGIADLMADLRTRGLTLAVLSNDVSEWSVELRHRFHLVDQISSWTISGDVGARKPDRLIYESTLRSLDLLPHEVLFLDDRYENVEAAKRLGMVSAVFSTCDDARQFIKREMTPTFPPTSREGDRMT